jgi:hypothetical protein
MTRALPNRAVDRPRKNLEIIADPERNDKMTPIVTGLMPNSVPTKGRMTTRTSFVEATAKEVHIAGFMPGRRITSRALIEPAASRSALLLTSASPLKKRNGSSESAATMDAKTKAEVEDSGRTPDEPAISPPMTGPTVCPSEVEKEKYPKL